MTVYLNKHSWWVDFAFDGKRHRKRSPVNTRSAAREYEALLQKRLIRGEPIIPVPARVIPTLTEFIPRWWETHVKTNNKPSEQRSKEYVLRLHLLPFFGKKRLNEIGTEDIERFKAKQLGLGKHPHTVNNHITVLRSCLARAFEWDVIEKLPRFKLLHGVPFERGFFTLNESRDLVEAAESPFWRAMILVALRTGMRYGELCGLEWSCGFVKVVLLRRLHLDKAQACRWSKASAAAHGQPPDLVLLALSSFYEATNHHVGTGAVCQRRGR